MHPQKTCLEFLPSISAFNETSVSQPGADYTGFRPDQDGAKLTTKKDKK